MMKWDQHSPIQCSDNNMDGNEYVTRCKVQGLVLTSCGYEMHLGGLLLSWTLSNHTTVVSLMGEGEGTGAPFTVSMLPHLHLQPTPWPGSMGWTAICRKWPAGAQAAPVAACMVALWSGRWGSAPMGRTASPVRWPPSHTGQSSES